MPILHIKLVLRSLGLTGNLVVARLLVLMRLHVGNSLLTEFYVVITANAQGYATNSPSILAGFDPLSVKWRRPNCLPKTKTAKMFFEFQFKSTCYISSLMHFSLVHFSKKEVLSAPHRCAAWAIRTVTASRKGSVGLPSK